MKILRSGWSQKSRARPSLKSEHFVLILVKAWLLLSADDSQEDLLSQGGRLKLAARGS